ncbi:A disintegrin and metalloproteinase with thrombospondin motifs adt-2-like isoform X2 [Linepithema humile]|uniref:A disintegrin and metalloproteinase with thrombospondin motifs adt-2-like isoform X2 n=1 Tax=Linepithema humile TaxID=83485 RepID=UPI000623B402|nr:PREDICTED: A disintegrin and metalloproteinase with thrombospondin motifs 2-like isoform X2 [Linepithema humile]
MFLLLKLVLIILINLTHAYITQDSEIILLPAWNPVKAKKIPLTLKVFGKFIQLNLRRNDQVASSAFDVWGNNARGVAEKLWKLKAPNICFYLHENQFSFAAINFCQEHGLKGIIFVEDDILEIRSLRNVFTPLFVIDDFCVTKEKNLSFGIPYLVKRSLPYFADSDLLHNIRLKRGYIDEIQRTKKRETQKPNVQIFFHHPTLGIPIDISLVHLDIWSQQPSGFLVFDNNVAVLLPSFCKYAETLNPSQGDPNHWDIGLYITGKTLYRRIRVYRGKWGRTSYRNEEVWGQTYFDDACSEHYSCAVVQFLPNEIESSGLKSSLNAVHLIGNLLGLDEDSDENQKNEYMNDVSIMSRVRPYRGNITWSSKSREKIKIQLEKKSCLRDNMKRKKLDDNDDVNNDDYDDNWSTSAIFQDSQYYGLPGREWTAKAQCELFLRDKDANVVTLHGICQNLQCETPQKNKFYIAGRALNGTYCALGKECRGGKCVPIIEPPYIFKYCEVDNWSEWKEDSCKSSCLRKSKGVLVKRRSCEHRAHRTANCIEPYYDMVICDDFLLCTDERWTIDEITTTKCRKFNKFAKDANLTGKLSVNLPGRQYPHDAKEPWKACTIYCRKKKSSDYYAPRQEMLNIGVDPYFPDGTLCHKKDGQDYYCRQHHCLPENYSFEEYK